MSKGVEYDSIIHKKRDKVFTPQEIEIMEMFTSPKWSKKTYLSCHNIVNMVKKNEIESNGKLINIESYEIENSKKSNFHQENIGQEKYSVRENKNISKKSNDSSQLLLRKKKTLQNNVKNLNKNRNKSNEFYDVHSFINNMSNKNVSSKTLKTMKITEKSGSKLTSNKDSIIEDFVSEDKKPLNKKLDKDLNGNVRFTNANAVKSYSENKSEELSLTRILDFDKKTKSQITSIISNEENNFNDLHFDSNKSLNLSKNDNKLIETVLFTNPNNIKNEDYFNRIFFEEQGTPVKRESTFTSSLSSKESHFNNKAFTNNDSDDIKNRYNSETVDLSSTWSLNTSTITRGIINQAQSYNLVTKRQREDLAINEAVEMIIEKAKISLGKCLVEGLYEVSRNYRHDPFTSLGKWLLIQADMRDEHKTEQESYDSMEDLSMMKNINSTKVYQ